ncbi:MAG: SRPBCC family protein [Pseudomonadota bacterium]
MTERSVSHATFVIERAYDAAPARVFAAWASPEAKSLWFGNLAKPDPGYQLDFRVGGRELNKGGPEGGAVYTHDGVYLEIVPDQRIALSYTMDMDQTRISVSIATVELKADGGRTRLIYTEQGAYFDGHDKPEFREHGTKELLNNLAAYLAR